MRTRTWVPFQRALPVGLLESGIVGIGRDAEDLCGAKVGQHGQGGVVWCCEGGKAWGGGRRESMSARPSRASLARALACARLSDVR